MPDDDQPKPAPVTRFFPKEQCCALLIDKRGNRKTYRKPDGDYIVSRSFRNWEMYITQPAFPLDNPSERESYRLSEWPDMDWKRMTVRFFRDLNCTGLLIHQKEDGTRIYRKPTGRYIHVKPDDTVDTFKVTQQEIIKNPSEPYAIRQNTWPGITWQESRKARIRFFIENNCSGILVNNEIDSRVYKTPTNGCIVFISLDGHTVRFSYPDCKLEFPTEGYAMNTNKWPGIDWKRPEGLDL